MGWSNFNVIFEEDVGVLKLFQNLNYSREIPVEKPPCWRTVTVLLRSLGSMQDDRVMDISSSRQRG